MWQVLEVKAPPLREGWPEIRATCRERGASASTDPLPAKAGVGKTKDKAAEETLKRPPGMPATMPGGSNNSSQSTVFVPTMANAYHLPPHVRGA